MPQILPLLNDNGLVLTQFPTFIENIVGDPTPALLTRITHVASGDSIEATAPLMLDKQTAQGLGSAITYMRRYALLSILGLVADVDDDGNQAETAKPAARRKPAERKPAERKPAAAASGSDDDW